MGMRSQLDWVAQKLHVEVSDELRQKVRDEVMRNLDRPVTWFGEQVGTLRDYVHLNTRDVLDSEFNSGQVSGAFHGWLLENIPKWIKID